MSLNKGNRGGRSKARRAAVVIAASLAGISVATVVSTVCIYDSFFKRYERPNYEVYPGLYCYDRVSSTLKRETFKIKSGKNNLQAYYYPAENSRGLAVLTHGIHAGADDYIPLIEAVVNRGYSVLAYDITGNYSSEGESGVGMCQSLVDLDTVLTYLSGDPRFCDMQKVLIGHSWGGYASASVLALHSEVRAAALIAPMNDGTTIMVETAEQYAGKAVYATKPIFDAYQKMLFGDYVKYNGVVGINSTNIPILIAQGDNDSIIGADTLSITAHLDELTNPNVRVWWGSGAQGGHSSIWHSSGAEEYRREVGRRLSSLEKQMGRSMTSAELRDFYSTVDHRLYSEVNSELVDLIISTFDKGLGL